MMNVTDKRQLKMEKGFTLLEIMISMSVGLVLFAGVISIFIGMRTTTSETSNYGELQENGRFAISVLTDDLSRQDFWGDYSGFLSSNNLISVPDQPNDDCVGDGLNNATFPEGVGQFRTIWGDTITAASLDPMGCFTTTTSKKAVVNSDVLQLKRVVASPGAVISAGNYYLRSSSSDAAIFTAGDADPIIANSQLWQYQHHVYYIRQTKVGDEFIPVLMQGRLSNLNMDFSPIVDGIEIIRFMYGVDTDSDGIVNAYISANNMTRALWDSSNDTKILAVKIFVLARGNVPDRNYDNTSTYSLGDFDYTVSDNYRRLLFSTTVTLFNNTIESW